MAWIEVHQSLINHKKTLYAADLLNILPIHFVGHIIGFWLWALDNTPEGSLDGITVKMIARAAQWEGDPQKFFDALLKAGFIDQDDEGYYIHDWQDYAGRLLEKKKANAERARRSREEKSTLRATCAQRARNECERCDATKPNLTIHNQDIDLNISGFLTESTAHGAEEVLEKSDTPTNKDLIAELTKTYREIEGIEPAKGDYAFIGALYNKYGYDQVLDALNNLQMAIATQKLQKPLLYLKGILERHSGPGPPAKVKFNRKKQGVAANRRVGFAQKPAETREVPDWEKRFYGE